MLSIFVIFVLSFIITLLITPALCKIPSYFKVNSSRSCNSPRHINTVEVPRIGGISIFLGYVISILAAYYYNTQLTKTLFSFTSELEHKFLVYLIGMGIIFTCGLIDDLFGLRIRYKLLFQIVATFLLCNNGFLIEQIDIPLVGVVKLKFLAWVVSFFWYIGIINAFNLIDGLDGLASGTAFIATLPFLVIAFLSQNHLMLYLIIGLSGALLAFLVFNFNPARIFLGDNGSMLIGYCLAVLSVWTSTKYNVILSFFIPIIALGLPIFDTLFAIIRRFLNGSPLFLGDADHLHHRLLKLGYSHKRAVLLLYGFSFLMTGLALLIIFGRDHQRGLAVIIFSIAIYLVLRVLRYQEVLHPIEALSNRKKRRLSSEYIQFVTKRALLLFSNSKDINQMVAFLEFWSNGIGAVEIETLLEDSIKRTMIFEHIDYYVQPYKISMEIKERKNGGRNLGVIKFKFYKREFSRNSDLLYSNIEQCGKAFAKRYNLIKYAKRNDIEITFLKE